MIATHPHADHIGGLDEVLNAFEAAQEARIKSKESRPVKENASYLLTGFMRCPKCGSPIGGTTLNGKYRYYKCRGASPTATRGKICDCGYIKADEVENFVWEGLRSRLSSLLNVIALFGKLYNARSDKEAILPLMERQIEQIEKKLKTYPGQEKKLYDLLIHESVTQEYVLEKIDGIKQQAEEGKRQLEQLNKMRSQTANASKLQMKLTELCKVINESLDGELSLEQKRKIMEGLSVKVEATPGNYKFTFSILAELTSDINEEFETQNNEFIRLFEERHPEVTLDHILDAKVALPEDTPFGLAINENKRKANPDLVTTGQTWGCLPFHEYVSVL